MSAELLPCPFCGSKDGPGVWMNHRVVCGGCDAEGPSLHDALEANLAAWNARAQSALQAKEAEIAALKEDAARFRWLLDNANIDFDPSEPYQLVIWEPGTGQDWKAIVRAAIDSARVAGDGEGKAS